MAEISRVILEFDETTLDRISRLIGEAIEEATTPLLDRIELLERAVEASRSHTHGYVPPPVYGGKR